MLNMNTQEKNPKNFTFVWTFESFDPNQLFLNLIEKHTGKKRKGKKGIVPKLYNTHGFKHIHIDNLQSQTQTHLRKSAF